MATITEKQTAAATLLTTASRYVEAGWTFDAFARDADGGETDHNSPAAAAWCAVGAVYAAAAGMDYAQGVEAMALTALIDELPIGDDDDTSDEGRIANWQDAFGDTESVSEAMRNAAYGLN